MKIVTVIGARPQFVKAAIWRRTLNDFPELQDLLIDTGQHYDQVMSYGILDELKVKKPDFSFTLTKRTHAGMLAEISVKLEKILIAEKPDWVVVFGDTDSALAAAITAVKLQIRVAHIEAGLRSGNFFQPEEINRKAIDHISTLLFCPTIESLEHAKKENLADRAFHSGDIMYDSIRQFGDKFIGQKDLAHFAGREQYVLLTLHRKENVENKERLQRCLDYVRQTSGGTDILFPCHPNTLQKISTFQINTVGIKILDPLKYSEMQFVLKNAHMLFTDSGGMQKEAYFHRILCVTLREETEWLETIQSGWNRLWTNPDYEYPRREILEYGQGNACEKIIEKILNY